MIESRRKRLNPLAQAPEIKIIEENLKANIIGQSESIIKITDALTRVFSGLRDPEKPILNLLFLGPTGTGKTETVKVLSKYLFGDRSSFTRINCQEFSNDFNISKLLGSPPGYVGNEIEPLLSQKNIDKHWKEALKNREGVFGETPKNKLCKIYGNGSKDFINIILFDEVEKADSKFWTTLLSIMDDGQATMANNKNTDFTHSIIIMTSNVGSSELQKHLKNNGIGFDLNIQSDDKELKELALEKAKTHFPPEFCNRFDDIIVFNSLKEKDLKDILEVQLRNFYINLMENSIPLMITFKDSAKNIIIKEGYSPEYGARNLNRSLQKLIITPLSRLIASSELIAADKLEIKGEKGEIVFIREPRKSVKRNTIVPKNRTRNKIQSEASNGNTGNKKTLANGQI